VVCRDAAPLRHVTLIDAVAAATLAIFSDAAIDAASAVYAILLYAMLLRHAAILPLFDDFRCCAAVFDYFRFFEPDFRCAMPSSFDALFR